MPRTGVIFDLDGTLTRPILDFDLIRRDIGLQPGPVLEGIAALPDERKPAAHAILERHERWAAEHAELHDGAADVLAALRARGLPVAILTRNARRWVDVVLDRFDLVVDAVHTRDDGVVKPAADGVLKLCTALRVDPAESWMVGDYLFDLQCGRAAGAATVLMIGDAPRPSYADQADHVIRRLAELLPLMV